MALRRPLNLSPIKLGENLVLHGVFGDLGAFDIHIHRVAIDRRLAFLAELQFGRTLMPPPAMCADDVAPSDAARTLTRPARAFCMALRKSKSRAL
jgi:hypothetical protein